MKEYLLGFWNKFKRGTIKFKFFVCTLILLYIGILAVCFIQVEVDSSLPGTVTSVSDVIDIESENESGNIYTVSIYSHSKMSILQYLLVKLDKNSSVTIGTSVNLEIFTENEEYASNVGYKNQSIQDSLIVAYNVAKEKGYDVTIKYDYHGQYLLNIPQNLYHTGSEDFKNSDIVLGYNGVDFTSEDDYLKTLDEIFDAIIYEEKSIKQYKEEGRFTFYDNDGKYIKENIDFVAYLTQYMKTLESTHKFKVLRNNEEKEITASLKMLFYLYSNVIAKPVENDKVTLYTITDNYYTKYNIDYNNCVPEINISKSDSVGPSGGLMQTLAIYNSITKEDITQGKMIMGTGGINLNGDATAIGGEQQKVVTAHLYDADIFFVPEVNYESAKEMFDTLNSKMEIVSVSNFADVISYLENMEVNNGE